MKSMDQSFCKFGFLPHGDPKLHFERYPELQSLKQLGKDLPSLLYDKDARAYLAQAKIPHWPSKDSSDVEELRLYYVRLGFIASGYVNQVGQEKATVLPKNIAVPFVEAATLLNRPPILSYDGYALYNWKRFNPQKPIALGNIDTFQNFVHLYDEHWFILVHVEIEAIAATTLRSMQDAKTALEKKDFVAMNQALETLGKSVWQQVDVLRRIPEHMDPELYYKTFRPYISFFENVVYEGVSPDPRSYRGETGAQSSIMPALIAFLKIPHQESGLTNHLLDMRNYMPKEHRDLLDELATWPAVKPHAEKEIFNDILEAMATFREVHYSWAESYINKHVKDPRGTGGTPYMQWLWQLVEETRAFKIQ